MRSRSSRPAPVGDADGTLTLAPMMAASEPIECGTRHSICVALCTSVVDASCGCVDTLIMAIAAATSGRNKKGCVGTKRQNVEPATKFAPVTVSMVPPTMVNMAGATLVTCGAGSNHTRTLLAVRSVPTIASLYDTSTSRKVDGASAGMAATRGSVHCTADELSTVASTGAVRLNQQRTTEPAGARSSCPATVTTSVGHPVSGSGSSAGLTRITVSAGR